jgi:hypothetical protein
MRAASNSYEFGQLGGSGGAGAEIAARVAARMPVRPEGAAPPEGMLAALQVYTLDRLEQACARSLPDGRPACAMIVADLNPHWPGDEALIVTDGGGGFTDVMLLHRDPAGGPGAPEGGWMDFGVEYLGDRFAAESGAETIARVLDGGFTIRPSGLSEVVIGGTTLLPRP